MMYNKAFEELDRRRHTWMTEEEVRLGWLLALQTELGIDFHAERGRSDADHNQVVIEFKGRGLFHGQDNSAKFKEAIYDRLAKYIPAKAATEGLSIQDYIGIAIDGDHIAFAYVPHEDAKIVHGPLMALSLASVSLVFDVCKFSTRRAITAENLIEDFGHSSRIGQNLLQVLCDILVTYIAENENNKVKMLFAEWKALYGQVADISEAQEEAIIRSVGFICTAECAEKLSIMLFALHTYNSILIKLLAAEIVSKIAYLTSYEDFAQIAATLENDQLLELIESDIEHAGLYSRAHIVGFVEECLFSWYVDAYKDHTFSEKLASALREMLIRLSAYQIGNLANAQTNDVLKCFYQNLIPETLRRSLGEFYTPDWLVDIALDKIAGAYGELRFLDPTCGSASFLLEIIKRIKQTSNLPSNELLKHIVNNVWGFDLNPLAVQTSRVNYLIAIADLIQDNPGEEIEIPVLLADAIYSPAPDPDGDASVVTYTIGSQYADLTITIPSSLALDRKKLDCVFEKMEECIERNLEKATAIRELEVSKTVTQEEYNAWHIMLEDTYSRVLSLHKQHWNGIWFRIIRNYFWSATAGKFDAVVGNPPWVRWSRLPELYRERVKPTCLRYDIFSHTPFHGGNELDISGMITYTVADKWLRNDGQLIFLLTQTHFQSASSAGFRRFCIDSSHYLKPNMVEDLKALKPFPDAANKTAIFVARKTTTNPIYPIPYIVWDAEDRNSKTIPEHLSKNEVLNRTIRKEKIAMPVNDIESPWAILDSGEEKLFITLKGKCNWVSGRKGITCDLNGVYFVNVVSTRKDGSKVLIRTRPTAGRTDIGPEQQFWVEPDLLYPLIKGARDIGPCSLSIEHSLCAIVPNRGITSSAYDAARSNVENDNPSLYKYLRRFERQLKSRSTYRTRMQNAPYYAVYNVGEYTFSPWKVVWAEQPGSTGFPSAVVNCASIDGIGRKVLIPDHKVYFADFNEASPAYYLCGLLQSNIVKRYLESFLITVQVGDIFTHMKLPEYNPASPIHAKIVDMVREAHAISDAVQKKALISEIASLGDQIVLK